MISHAKSYQSTTAETIIDLRAIGTPGGHDASLVFNVADFDIEIIDNDAEVTVEVVGPFTSSEPAEVTDGTIAIGGGKKTISNAALGSIVFTRTGTTAYTINIVRTIRN